MPNRIIDGRGHKLHRTGLHILAITLALYAVAVVVFFLIGDTPWVNKLSATNIAVSFILCGLAILIFTEEWLWRRAGAMISILGAGVGYLFISGVAWNVFAQNPDLSKALIRAALNVGGPLFTAGILRWGYERWKTRHSGNPDRDPLGLIEDDRR